jgi:hypothetical protein
MCVAVRFIALVRFLERFDGAIYRAVTHDKEYPD